MQAYIVFLKESELNVSTVATGAFIYVWDSADPARKLGFKTREGTVCWIAFGAEEDIPVPDAEAQEGDGTEKAAEINSTAS